MQNYNKYIPLMSFEWINYIITAKILKAVKVENGENQKNYSVARFSHNLLAQVTLEF